MFRRSPARLEPRSDLSLKFTLSEANVFRVNSGALRPSAKPPDEYRDGILGIRNKSGIAELPTYSMAVPDLSGLQPTIGGSIPINRDCRPMERKTVMRIKVKQRHRPYYRWTREEIIQSLQERVRQNLSLRSLQIRGDYPALFEATKRMFGTWKKAYRAAGIKAPLYPRWQRKWTKSNLLAALRTCYQQHPQQLPNHSKAQRHCAYLWKTGFQYHYFSDRNAVLRKLGFPSIHYRNNYRWSAAGVIKQLQDRFRRGKQINTMTLLRENRFLYIAARHKFGSFAKAIRAAGFDFERIRSTNKAGHFTRKMITT
jgi:hypothetical protein